MARFDHTLYCQHASASPQLDQSTLERPGSLTRVFRSREWEASWKYHDGSLSRLELNRATPELRLRYKLEIAPRINERYLAERSNPANYINAREFVGVDRAKGIVDPDLHILRKQLVGTFRNTDVVLKE